jgi:tRNA U34 5-methylaminomethyl-2-thiouridine-forming methyltransferase MnmC
MHNVVSVRPLEDYQLEVTFDDGTCGTASLKDRLFGPVFEPLRNPEFFRQAFVDEFGAVSWPNGADLAPDALYEQIRSKVA